MTDQKSDQLKKTQQAKNTDDLLVKLREKAKLNTKKPSDTTPVLSDEQVVESVKTMDIIDEAVADEAVSPVVEPEATNKPVSVVVLQENLDKGQRGVTKLIALPPNTFQYYNCSIQSMRMCTSNGTPIIFKDFQLVTDNIDIIAYLEHELSKELESQGITRGALLTKEEMDPMEVLRKQHIAEYIASEAAATAAALQKEQEGSATGILTSGNVVTSQDSN